MKMPVFVEQMNYAVDSLVERIKYLVGRRGSGNNHEQSNGRCSCDYYL